MSKVLSAARQLPAESQLLLVKELLMGLQKETPFEFKKINDGTKTLEGLSGLTDNELHALADAMMPAEKQQRLTRLLRKNSSGTITGKETEELDALLVLCQQISLLKAKAILTLQQRGAHEK
jgi:phage-related minor tail protein